jgi:NAD(P)-dependent dehydrogenase (short-subunit alcohol dehydrogenase family)
VHFAREGADVAIVYLDEHKDADETAALVEKEGRKCLKFAGDVGKPEVSQTNSYLCCAEPD